MTNRDAILYWWPVIARLGGIVGAFIQAGVALATSQSADVAFLGFCGALVAAPAIFPTDASSRKAPKGGTNADDRNA